MGTSMRGPGAVLWTWQICDIALAALGLGVAFKHLEFMLVPLTLAYFLTFLMAPIMDLLEKRPLALGGGIELCKGSAPYDRHIVKYDEAESERLGEKVPCYDENRNEVWVRDVSIGSDSFFQMTTDPETGEVMRLKDKHTGEDIRTVGMEKFIKELTMLGKVPHMLACTLTLLGTVAILYLLLVVIIGGAFAKFADEEQKKVDAGAKSMMTKLEDMGNDYVDYLEKQEGLIIVRKRECMKRNITETKVHSEAKDDLTVDSAMFGGATRNMALAPVCKKVALAVDAPMADIRTYNATSFRCQIDIAKMSASNSKCRASAGAAAYCAASIGPIDFPTTPLANVTKAMKALQAAAANSDAEKAAKLTLSNMWLKDIEAPKTDIFVGVKIFNFVEELNKPMPNCTKIPIFGAPSDGMGWNEFIDTVLIFVGFLNQLVLIVLLAVYILLERPEGQTMSGDHRVMLEIENMIKMYINLKTALSFGTGVMTAILLGVCGVPLFPVFGLMAFLLNYIPNVGSIIAMCCPVPIIILDDELSKNPTMQVLAFLGPALVQGYVGNALEPAVFGKSLNMTEMAVLLALVFFAGLWGLSGAVLSVPFLGIMKIVAHHTEHPLAKHFLGLVRADDNFA